MNITVCCVISVPGIAPRIHPYYDRKYSWLPLPVSVSVEKVLLLLGLSIQHGSQLFLKSFFN